MTLKNTILYFFPVLLGIFIGAPVMNRTAAQQATDTAANNAVSMFNTGRQIFRFDTFGDQAFWGGQLKLHQAIERRAQGGVGPV